MTEYDVAIVGLGALGSAAAYHAAKKGAKVVAFEQFELGHVRGSSHDTSRIVRTSYDQPGYVALARASYRDWADLEKAAGQKLLHITGGLIFVKRNGPTNVNDDTRSLTANDVPFEVLDGKEVAKRWPQFPERDEVDVVFTPDTGMAHAAKSVSAMQHLARGLGAVLRENTRVDAVQPQTDGKGVVIRTSNG